jgi:hypothetical protein
LDEIDILSNCFQATAEKGSDERLSNRLGVDVFLDLTRKNLAVSRKEV